ncbi:MobF family relaxase [Sulfuricurvum sp.]|uniref:MobF family relaxase n=1 Tax=Sulfuricurvum sp. TaxID=2025608 RepID=UPI002617A8AC|nr:MobF family relaxase [Sulfuricurvum sp.]MDD2267057.1 MobF family relaxase [Sulfuricurvum sp.]
MPVESFMLTGKRTDYHFAIDKYIHHSMWLGNLCDSFNLTKKQKVIKRDFEILSSGINPITKKQLIKENTTGKKRFGIEIVIPKPKTVSLVQVVAFEWDENLAMELMNVDINAYTSLIEFIEKEHVLYRVRSEKYREKIRSNSCITANFMHLFNSSDEQQAHTHWHCVLFPFTKNRNQYYALQNPLIIRSSKLYGALYRSELAKRLITCGYSLRLTDKKYGFFEIEGISDQIKTLFSSRSNEIEKYKLEFKAHYHNAPGYKIAHLAKFKNRQKQSEKDVSKIIRSNVEKLESAGFTFEHMCRLKMNAMTHEPINLAEVIYEIYRKEGEKLFKFSKERILKNIAIRAIVRGTGAYIDEIYKPFQGGDYVEVVKRFINQKIQKNERIQDDSGTRRGVVENYTGGVFELSKRGCQNARRAHEYFDKYCQNLNDAIYIAIDERICIVRSEQNRERGETFGSYSGTETMSEDILFNREDEVWDQPNIVFNPK